MGDLESQGQLSSDLTADLATQGAAMDFDRDIFGHPVDPRRGLAGRPRHFATPELRAQVRALHEHGLSQPKIAAAIGITVPTLVLHYPRELNSSSQAWRRHVIDHSTEGE